MGWAIENMQGMSGFIFGFVRQGCWSALLSQTLEWRSHFHGMTVGKMSLQLLGALPGVENHLIQSQILPLTRL